VTAEPLRLRLTAPQGGWSRLATKRSPRSAARSRAGWSFGWRERSMT